tara:strand:+ start:25894 stop:26607 length:714 start_codon:yes stop_codon:yes gene_type:complete
MKKLLVPLCAALLASNAAYADSYVRAAYSQANYDEQDLSIGVTGPGGGVLLFDGYDYGSSDYFSLAYGMSISERISAEVELAYPMSDTESSSVLVGDGGALSAPGTFELEAESLQLTINAAYHFMERKAGGLDPYVMAGIGIADNSIEGQRVTLTPTNFATVEDGDGTEFMYKFGAGLGYHINDKMTVDLSVTYVDAGTVESGKSAAGAGTSPVPLSEALEFELETINYGLGFSYAL